VGAGLELGLVLGKMPLGRMDGISEGDGEGVGDGDGVGAGLHSVPGR